MELESKLHYNEFISWLDSNYFALKLNSAYVAPPPLAFSLIVE